MKSFTPSKLIIVVYVALFMAKFPGNTYSAPKLIETTCKATSHYDLCVKTLQSDPGSSRADVKGLANIAARGLFNQGMATWNKIYEMLQKTKDLELKKPFLTCLKAYSTITVDDMNQAFSSLTRGNPKEAISGFSDVLKQTEKCEKSFRKSPFTSDNKLVNDLAEVVISIAKNFL
ncbi:cell wall / vacuolar inhibitor of fructosidase 1-like [Mangifera indica]|uniref:cell wall / vacuolar inhibitor of fructosidase 1-like n=1 Tax=Mangifera indica TaxID=29780 RepID=UPI001CFBE182|nr:cell wall / vacuolar inhibitor of fructosidase 1-like [Mangifera indica]